ncbi:MAG TPA: glycosyltransferase family 87 protein [Labilithrix sp.]|nr:glycosyltransferase family 87 protein [Labilithrix sp.]
MQLRFPDRRSALAIFVLAGVLAGAISWAAGQSQNFDVFRAAADALVEGDDLYTKSAADYFKYSPTFALLFVPFTWGPAWLLAPLWSALNFGLAGWGLDRLFAHDVRKKRVAQVVALAGIVVATDGDQSNLLVAGAILLAFVAYEAGHVRLAAHLVAAATLVKIFPLAFAALVLFLPRSQRKPALSALAGALFTWVALPLLLIAPEELAEQYRSWHALLGRDHANHGWSLMSLLQDGLGLRWSTAGIQLLALAAQAFPILMGVRLGTDRAWRRTLVCSLLCFSVLFNHRAEYATFAISAVAVGVWYASAETPPSPWRRVLVVLAIVAPGPFFTRANLDTSGIVSLLAAHRLFHPLRVLPLLAVWGSMQHELLARFFEVRVRVRTLVGGREHAP